MVFTGPIYDKKELWEYYNRAKVFILSSIFEGFPLVFGEARRFSCYIISTDVGGARDTVGANKYGRILNIGDVASMRTEIINIIEGNTIVDVYHDNNSHMLAWDNLIENLELDTIL